jgi:acyl dehydratase
MERLRPGDAVEVPLRFAQADFDEFARLSGDDNPIHVDPGFADRTKFGRTVAHGMMLFGVLDAAVGRWLGRPITTWSQELTFPAPTFADDDLVATLRIESADRHSVRIGQWLRRSDGADTAGGFAVVGLDDSSGPGDEFPDPPPESSGELFGVRPGMRTTARRVIGPADVAAYRDLVADTNPRRGRGGVIPVPLLGGTVSYLLGVELPGRGTNWLRQRFTFCQPVPVGATVETEVEVVRVRPDKALVDLATSITVAGRMAATGESLVLISDLESH